MHKKLAIVAIFSLIAPRILAYGPCDKDAEKLCSDLGHKETLKNCLHRLKNKTSSECQSFLQSQEGSWQKLTGSWSKVLEVCKREFNDLCKETLVMEGGEGAFKNMKDQQVCLMAHREKLQPQCKSEINRHIKEYQPNLNTL